jgi:hypothetical protein
MSGSYARIASIKPLTPKMLITLFMLQARTCSAISVPTCLSVFIWKCVDPMAKAHFRRVSIEPRLHGLKDGFVLPT